MAGLLEIKATETPKGITWSWVDADRRDDIQLDIAPSMKINDGDVWKVSLVEQQKLKGAPTRYRHIVRLIAKRMERKAWQNIKSLDNFWIDAIQLQCLLIWLHQGSHVVLVGPKGTGKTTLAFAVARTLGWQDPCKVDVYTIRKTTDLFGSDAATEGSTRFSRSPLLDYIERAQIAYEHSKEHMFLVVLDEINRVHSKSSEGMHGLFDDTKQVSFVTADKPITVKIPPNMRFIGTMNEDYAGTYQMDEALKDRFTALRLKPMPHDIEVKRLAMEARIREDAAEKIVRVAELLRDAVKAGHISTAPSFRGCRDGAGHLVSLGVDLRHAIVMGLLGWYQGTIDIDANGKITIEPNSEADKAYAALRMTKVMAETLSLKAV